MEEFGEESVKIRSSSGWACKYIVSISHNINQYFDGEGGKILPDYYFFVLTGIVF